MSTWLAFDAGSPVTSAAVARAGELLGAGAGASRGGPSLLQQIDASLRGARVELRELDGIVVLSGPGSFTGIRVALATALAFRAGLALPVFALSNLAALALQAEAPTSAPVLALIDALREEWFWQEFSREAGAWQTPAPPRRHAAPELRAPAGAVLAAHEGQALPEPLAHFPVRRASELTTAVAKSATLGELDALLSSELEPLYLRAFTPRTPQLRP